MAANFDMGLAELYTLAELLSNEEVAEKIPAQQVVQQQPEQPQQHQQQRYAEYSNAEADEFILLQKKQNTVRSTNTALKQFEEWLRAVRPNETRPVCDISPADLNDLLAAYFLGARQKNGAEYEPDTLTSYQRGIDRFLQDNNYPYSIIRDKQFQRSRQCLAAKRVELKKQGKGNKPNAAEVITQEEQEILMEKGIIGRSTPEALFNSVWMNNTKMLGFRGGQENRDLKWGDIQPKMTAGGQEYLEFNERETKTRYGQAGAKARPFNPKMFATPETPDKCPVATYHEYARRRPHDMKTPDSPFYLSINYIPVSDVWFKKLPMGKNKLAKVVQDMTDKAGISGKKTNHSVRKTAITKLLHAGIPPTQLQQLSGHSQVQSVNHYAVASLEQQHEMSDILSGTASKSIVPSTSTSTVTNTSSQIRSDSTYQTGAAATAGIFHSAVIHGGTFTINVNTSACGSPKRKRPRRIIYDTSSSENSQN